MTQAVSAPPAANSFPPVVSSVVRDASISFFTTACNAKPIEVSSDSMITTPCAGIMGLLSFFGDFMWSFALALPEPTAVSVAKTFAGFDIPFDSSDMGDIVGEIGNVIAGDIVARLDAAGIKAQMSLPTIARGSNVELLPPQNASTVKMWFDSPSGPFWFRLVKAADIPPHVRRSGV